MIALTAAEIAAATGGVLHPATLDPHTCVTGPVVVDSRGVEPGALFVALPGEHVDGHTFAAAAVRAGASLVLAAREVAQSDDDGAPCVPCVLVDDVEKALGDLARDVLTRLRSASATSGGAGLRVVAVTGSVGKTTTKDLLAQVLGAVGPTVAPERSFNNEIGLPLTVLRADLTTRYLVLEMGASGLGHLAYLTSIAPPDVAVVLVVGSAHLGEFGGIDAVAQAKGELVQGLAPGGTAVLNVEDQRVAAMATHTDADVVLFGGGPTSHIRARDVSLDRAGRVSFLLVGGGRDQPEETAPVQLQLVGEHHLTNALATAAASITLGVPLRDVAGALSTATALSPHRMHVVDRHDGVTIVDDAYNANPDSMQAALKALAVISGRTRRSVAVLGEMRELGSGSRAAHEQIGLMVVRLNIALTVVVGEGAAAIAQGAVREGSWGEEVVLVPDVDTAATFLADELRPGDVVLVKSSYGAGLWRLADRLLCREGDQ